MAGRVLGGVENGVNGVVDKCCCECWQQGCGLDGCFGTCADTLEAINPVMEYIADLIWFLGSPLAFPLIYCFDKGPDTEPPGGGWQIPMIQTPLRLPIMCCAFTICAPCGQWYMRRRLLDGDMTKYKLWQGYHDGPHCMARRCPGAPITIEAGTYGEDKCPELFLCAEVTCLGGFWSVCCSYNVNRRMIKEQRNLGDDPTEVRVNKCIGFFSALASKLCMLGCCVCISSRLIGCCANDSAGAQQCSGQGVRAGNACRSCARTCWRGIWSVKMIAMGCASAQMNHELKEGKPLASPPIKKAMDRGAPTDETNTEADDEDQWWNEKKKDGY
ncbi:hypothetical protein IV203_015548 [Nitzschia inconspicua]|uniref:Uncharacterized protein n=1 Tax=Nitzschia inconspicua TaxID=303405 RepID=A0A9K3LC19_9STRA|nr:hypothetical protein IV203_015548 [Nitzschia inconspicua]